MNNNMIKAFMNIMLAGSPEVAVKRFIEGGCGQIVNYLNDYNCFKSCVADYIQSIQSENTREQLEEIIHSVEGKVFEQIRKKNMTVIIDLDEELECKFSEAEILPEIRTNLKDTFVCYILTYIHKKDPGFFNSLKMQINLEQQNDTTEEQNQRIRKLEIMCTNLQALIRDITSEEISMVPVIKGYDSLNINDSILIDDRTNEIEQIDNIFKMGSHVAFLYGRPGIGKTTLAKLYANHCIANQIYFVKYEQSIEYTISKLSSEPGKYTGQDILNYWHKMVVEGHNTILLIIDNFNEDRLQGKNKRNFMTELSGEFYKNLVEIGIRIIFTTRINVGNNVFEVQPVEETFELFSRYCGSDIITLEQEIQIKKIISAVHSNTLLIVLTAHIWRRSNTVERGGLLKAIVKGTLQNNKNLIPINAEIETMENEMTIFKQIAALLDFSSILNDDGLKKIFANVALLPLQGLSKFAFLDLLNYENDNDLNDLINGCWVLCENNMIMMHPIIREIAFAKEIVSYSLCREYCENICVNLDIEKPLNNRIVYKECAYEIFDKFKDIEEMDIILVRLFYRLSDIFDSISEKEISMEITDVISRNIVKMESFSLERARMLSGIAYSINNCFDSMDDLEKADRLLGSAKDIAEELEITQNNRLQYALTYGKILSNYGSNCISKGRHNSNQADAHFTEALEWHRSALEFRQNQLDRLYVDADIRKKMKAEVATAYTNVATSCFLLRRYKEAIEYHLKAYEIRKELRNENAQSVNLQRIIGCVLEIYKHNLGIDSNLLIDVLNYYPDILKTNYYYKNMNSLKINLSYFSKVATIIQYDKRFPFLMDELNDKTRQIADWLKDEDELMTILKEQVERIYEMVFGQTKQ